MNFKCGWNVKHTHIKYECLSVSQPNGQTRNNMQLCHSFQLANFTVKGGQHFHSTPADQFQFGNHIFVFAHCSLRLHFQNGVCISKTICYSRHDCERIENKRWSDQMLLPLQPISRPQDSINATTKFHLCPCTREQNVAVDCVRGRCCVSL